MIKEFLAVGIDPNKSVIFKQSSIVEHLELYTLFQMMTPVARLERCPTYKDLDNEQIRNFGFLGYPLLQSADILLYDADFVPVGKDQLPHIEICKEMAKKFNFQYEKDIFKEPKEILSEFPKVLGVDGRKMSKSYNNSIEISISDIELEQKIKSMYTDPLKMRKNDIGHPEGCMVNSFNNIYGNNIESDCKKGLIGCSECKKNLKNIISNRLNPIKEKLNNIKDDECIEILNSGNKIAKKVAQAKMEVVKKLINID
jgi:tryptophanyl-tRNA synthetase